MAELLSYMCSVKRMLGNLAELKRYIEAQPKQRDLMTSRPTHFLFVAVCGATVVTNCLAN